MIAAGDGRLGFPERPPCYDLVPVVCLPERPRATRRAVAAGNVDVHLPPQLGPCVPSPVTARRGHLVTRQSLPQAVGEAAGIDGIYIPVRLMVDNGVQTVELTSPPVRGEYLAHHLLHLRLARG